MVLKLGMRRTVQSSLSRSKFRSIVPIPDNISNNGGSQSLHTIMFGTAIKRVVYWAKKFVTSVVLATVLLASASVFHSTIMPSVGLLSMESVAYAKKSKSHRRRKTKHITVFQRVDALSKYVDKLAPIWLKHSCGGEWNSISKGIAIISLEYPNTKKIIRKIIANLEYHRGTIGKLYHNYIKDYYKKHGYTKWIQKQASVFGGHAKPADNDKLFSVIVAAYVVNSVTNLNPYVILARMQVESEFSYDIRARDGGVGLNQIQLNRRPLASNSIIKDVIYHFSRKDRWVSTKNKTLFPRGVKPMNISARLSFTSKVLLSAPVRLKSGLLGKYLSRLGSDDARIRILINPVLNTWIASQKLMISYYLSRIYNVEKHYYAANVVSKIFLKYALKYYNGRGKYALLNAKKTIKVYVNINCAMGEKPGYSLALIRRYHKGKRK